MSRLTYADYLRLDSLMSLQQPLVPATADREVVQAERFFIVTHQCCELWLGQVIGDLDAATDALSQTDAGPELTHEYLDRAREVLRLLHEHLLCLEKLPQRGFVEFRTYLGTASGAQSTGFRLLDQRLGDETRDGPLYQAFTVAAARAGLSVVDVCRMGSRAGVWHRLAESMLDLGCAYWRWKVAHLALVARTLGAQPGTGGTSGDRHLARHITMPFAELRRLRGELHLTAVSSDN